MSIKLADAIVYLAAENAKLKDQLAASERDTKSWTSRVADGIAIGIGNAVVNAVGRGVQAVGNLGRSVVSFSTDSARAVGLFQAQLGASADEAQALTKISQEVWKNNYGSNVLEAAENVALVRRQLHQLGAEGIRDVTQVGFALRDTFGTDMPKYIDAVRSLMDNFGVSHQQAMNIITAGYQRGLDRSGDFLESITEYAPQFATAKASADQFFSAMETGLQGGILGTDKALDMFKEFRVRLLDGSETTATGLRQIGLSMDDITTRVNNGSLTWADAFTLIQDKLRGTDDQALQMQAGVALLGTQFEDMGTQAALAVDLTATSLEELDGAAGTLGARYQNIGDLAHGMGRRFIAALSPAADVITNMANQAMPLLDTAFQRLEANATVFAGGIVGIIRGIWAAFQTFFTALHGGSDKEFGKTANNAGAWGKNIVLQLARGMAAATIAVVRVLNQIGQIIAHWLQPHSPPLIAPNIDKWGQATMQLWLDSFGSANLDVLRTMGSRVMGFLGKLKDGAAVQMVGTISSAISGLFQGTAAEDDTGLIGRILGSKEVIARAITEIQDFGGVGADTLAMLEQALGSLPPVALDYVQAMLQLQQANQAVTAAQEELNRVTKEYDDRLKPINDELAAIQRQQQDEADAKRMAELQKAIARGQLTDEQKRHALAQLRELELRKQQRALEAERDTAVDAAQEQLDAAEEQQKAAQQQADLQAALIEQQREANDLVQQQISLLDRLANVMAGVGDALGNALSGASLGDALGNIGNMGDLGIADGLDGELQNLADSLDIEGLVDDILNEFQPLNEEMGTLGTTVQTLRTNFDSFLKRLGILNEDGTVATDTIQAIKDGVIVLGAAFVAAKIATWIGSIVTAIAGLSSGAGIFGAIGAAVTALGGPFVVLAAIVAGFVAAWNTDFLGMRTTLEQVWVIIEYVFQQMGEKITAALAPIISGFYTSWTQIWWPEIQGALDLAWSNMQYVWEEIGRWINHNLVPWILYLQAVWNIGWTAIKTALNTAWLFIEPIWTLIKTWLSETLVTALQSLLSVWESSMTSLSDAVTPVRDMVQSLWDAVSGFWEWLKDKVFNFQFHLPDLPDWAIPGSPIPLHTAWKKFAEEMNNMTIKPQVDTSQMAGLQVGEPGTMAAAAPSSLAPAAPVTIHIEQVTLGDTGSVDRFFEYLSALSGQRDLVRFGSIAS